MMSGAQKQMPSLSDKISDNKEGGKALPFVIYEKEKFIIPNEAKELLSSLTYKNIGIISLVGKYRTGKSFLLNRVLLNRVQSSGFGVGPSIKPCTKGIWIWSQPLIISNNHCKEPFPCFLIDTEGLGAYDEEVNHDSKIFLIAILISSLFIFNSFGTIDENAISSLSFVLNLSKTIKLRNNSTIDNENELAEYFPTLFWLLRDFSLKLEDVHGNVITEKQYLEYALQNMKGASDAVEEKNQVRSLIRTYFPERDCFVMVRPVEKESDLQNLQQIPDNQLRKEFVEQAKIFRNKVTMKTRPKVFMKQNLTGAMLVELVQSVLDAINGGNIPVIENSWKYVIQNECIKNSDNALKKFTDEINQYRASNSTDPNFANNVKKFTRDLADKYLKNFTETGLFDDDSKREFSEKLKGKINDVIDKFDKENEKIFEEKFNKDIDAKTKKFLSTFEESDKYSKNYFEFFDDLEKFKNESEKLTPEFPSQKEIIFDKLMIIIRRFIDTFFVKVKLQNEKQIALYKTAIDKLQNRLKELNNELIEKNKSNTDSINTLNTEIRNEKIKQKEYEGKILILENQTKATKDSCERQLQAIRFESNQKIEAIQKEKAKLEESLRSKNEEMLVLKMNNEKTVSLNKQKFSYLEKEIENWKERLNSMTKDTENKEKSYKDEISLLRAQNESLKTEQKQAENNAKTLVNQNMNNLVNLIQTHLKTQNEENKNMIEKFITNQAEKEATSAKDKEMLMNFKEVTAKNQELSLSLSASEMKIKQLEEQINKLNLYKDIVHYSNGFRCKICNKIYAFEAYKPHINNCTVMNTSQIGTESILLDKLKIKILKGRVKQDELGKPYLEYIIDINYNGQNWRINKRFNQFANLYKTLKTLCKGVVNMPSSSSIFVNINGVGQSNSFHENKILQLEKFIKDLSEIDVINKSKPFRKFLEFEQFVNDDEDEIEIKQVENSRNKKLGKNIMKSSIEYNEMFLSNESEKI